MFQRDVFNLAFCHYLGHYIFNQQRVGRNFVYCPAIANAYMLCAILRHPNTGNTNNLGKAEIFLTLWNEIWFGAAA